MDDSSHTPERQNDAPSEEVDVKNQIEEQDETFKLTILHHGTPHTFTVTSSSTMENLSKAVHAWLSISEEYQKFYVSPKVGLLKPPFSAYNIKASALRGKKITLMGHTACEIRSLSSNVASSAASQARRGGGRPGPVKPATPARTRDWQREKADAEYTFHTLRALPHLPRPERSQRFLETLRDDAGVRAAMRAHRFSVPLLTEMDPAAHTTHDARTLGLNRNRGEVIELRLRTDAGDGYRDYRTIRRTLCHELAHNVWGEHDRSFWDLTAQIEKEVERGDWRRGGRALGEEEFYNPDDGGFDGEADHGGWTGGEFVLGGGGEGGGGSDAAGAGQAASSASGQLSRREILARAAEERMRKAKDLSDAAEQDGGEGSASGEK